MEGPRDSAGDVVQNDALRFDLLLFAHCRFPISSGLLLADSQVLCIALRPHRGSALSMRFAHVAPRRCMLSRPSGNTRRILLLVLRHTWSSSSGTPSMLFRTLTSELFALLALVVMIDGADFRTSERRWRREKRGSEGSFLANRYHKLLRVYHSDNGAPTLQWTRLPTLSQAGKLRSREYNRSHHLQ